ncbi:MAG: CoA transferase [Comamonadaceae bacterium]|nr:MAG: CoA transferase [Comamonadaceae bacterium]
MSSETHTAPGATAAGHGPLRGIRVIEMAGLGPAPFCGMLLADMGAEVIRIARIGADAGKPLALTERGKHTLGLDLKHPDAVALALDLIGQSDVLIEGFRPGVMERLGLGPQVCQERNPRLVYGRMTGWGQAGPLAQAAGHDLNYIAITGVLQAMGEADRPPAPPLHLVGDLAGGAMMLAWGIACALFESRGSAQGQVIDAAICDGVAALSTSYHDPVLEWTPQRQANMLDGGAHFYGCYACADGRFVSIGPIEPQFYALLLARCGIVDPQFESQWNRAEWPALRAKLSLMFQQKTQAQWCELLEGTDVCFAPVLDFAEATRHPHLVAREVFMSQDGRTVPAPAPRLSRTPARAGSMAAPIADAGALLERLGCPAQEAERLRAAGVLG